MEISHFFHNFVKTNTNRSSASVWRNSLIVAYDVIAALSTTSCSPWIFRWISVTVWPEFYFSWHIARRAKDSIIIIFSSPVRSTRRAIVVTPVVRVPVTLRQSLIRKFFKSSYLDSHSSESIHIWTKVPWRAGSWPQLKSRTPLKNVFLLSVVKTT